MNSQPQYIGKKTNALKSYQLTNFIELLLMFKKYTLQYNIPFFREDQIQAFVHIKDPQFDFNQIFDNKEVFDLFIKLLTQKKAFKISKNKKLKAYLIERELSNEVIGIDKFVELACFYNLINKLKKLNSNELQMVYKDFFEIRKDENIPNYFKTKQNYDTFERFLESYPRHDFLEQDKEELEQILDFW